MKNVFLIGSLAVSLCANALMLAGCFPVTLTATKPALVPVIYTSPAAPPIRSAVPLPKPKPVAQAKQHKKVVHKHHKKHVKKVVKVKRYVSPLVKAEPTPAPAPAKTLKPLEKKAKPQVKSMQPQFTCDQLPKAIVDVSPDLIRTSGFANGYSAVTINKVLFCRKQFGGTG